jgi:hypothetical protein
MGCRGARAHDEALRCADIPGATIAVMIYRPAAVRTTMLGADGADALAADA